MLFPEQYAAFQAAPFIFLRFIFENLIRIATGGFSARIVQSIAVPKRSLKKCNISSRFRVSQYR